MVGWKHHSFPVKKGSTPTPFFLTSFSLLSNSHSTLCFQTLLYYCLEERLAYRRSSCWIPFARNTTFHTYVLPWNMCPISLVYRYCIRKYYRTWLATFAKLFRGYFADLPLGARRHRQIDGSTVPITGQHYVSVDHWLYYGRL